MNIFIFSASVLFSLGGIFSLTRQLQMLQQNSYFPSRYAKWLKENANIRLLVPIAAALCCALLYIFNFDILLLIFSAAVAAIKAIKARINRKSAIKPLVYTLRVKRMYVSAAFLFGLIIAGEVFLHETVFFAAAAFLSFAPCVTAFAVRMINAPLDNLITRWYISDAKKMLKNHGNLTVVGITGSYGKTGTKYILAAFLEQKYNVLYTPNSFNTPMGIVRTVRENLQPQTQIFIAEMGAKNVGDIKECCDIAKPTTGIITSVGPQHLDTFKTTDNVLKTKFELSDFVTACGGNMFLNGDNELIRDYAKNANNCTFFGADGGVRYENTVYDADGLRFDIICGDTVMHIKTKLLGLHNVVNITGAAAVALSLGVKPKDIEFAATRLKPVSHRLELKPFINSSLLLDDAYNANPDGSLKAVDVLSKFGNRKKVIVTPGLVELGEKEYECNYNLGAAAAKVCNVIILVGETRAKPLADGVKSVDCGKEPLIVPKFTDAMEQLKKITDNNTVVLFENDLPDNYAK